MAQNDFDKEFGEERDMPADLHEKTPGVYVRAENELPHELDMLWSHTRTYNREDRSPLVPFIGGALVGAVVTAAIFMLLVIRPQVGLLGETDLMAPITEAIDDTEAATIPKTAAKAGATAQSASALAHNMRTYTVGNGDTLGGIAYKMYGSSAPKYVEKIQRANNMKSADSLQIDQKLTIPPKGY